MSIPVNEDFRPQSRVDFGWLSHAWAFFKAQPGAWVTACLLYFVIVTALWVLWAIPTGTLADMEQIYLAVVNHASPVTRPHNAYWQFAQGSALSLLLTGVNVILYGGFYRMALRQANSERISALGLFSAFPQAQPLFLIGFVMAGAVLLLETLVLWLLHLYHFPAQMAVTASGILAALPSIILEGLLMFAPLLVLDRKMTAAEALVGSVRLLKGQKLQAVWFYFVASLVGSLGALFCGIGLLATYPVFLISLALGYLALTRSHSAPVSPYSSPQAGVWPPPPIFDDKSGQ